MIGRSPSRVPINYPGLLLGFLADPIPIPAHGVFPASMPQSEIAVLALRLIVARTFLLTSIIGIM